MGEQTKAEREAIEKMLRQDLLGGTAISRTRADGTIERIDPKDFWKRPEENPDDAKALPSPETGQ